MSSKAEIEKAIAILTRVLQGVPDAPPRVETRPAPRELVSAAVPAGWTRAKVKAVSDKEIETSRGPARKFAMKLAWREDGQDVEVWASTFREDVIAEAETFGKGMHVEVQLSQKGQFWNLLGIRESSRGSAPITEEDVPF